MAKYRPESARRHTVYTNAEGTRLPGVTTITGQIAKHLERWANNLGLEGFIYDPYMADLAAVGTAAHEICMAHLEGREPRLGNVTEAQMKAAKIAANKFIAWAKRNKSFRVISTETPLVSEGFQTGGTMDIYGYWRGKRYLFDLKTSDSGIYLENFIQVAAYACLALENGYDVDMIGVIRIAKDPSQKMEMVVVSLDTEEWSNLRIMFGNLRQNYELTKKLKKALGVR